MIMKRIGMIACLVLGLVACDRDEPDVTPAPGPAPVGSSMTAQLGQISFTAEEVTVIRRSPDTLMITGSRNPARPTFIALNLYDYTGPDTYAVTGLNTTAVLMHNGQLYSTGSGSVIVDQDQAGELQGRFSFQATSVSDTRQVQNGRFSHKP
jgi:hypothetical protein